MADRQPKLIERIVERLGLRVLLLILLGVAAAIMGSYLVAEILSERDEAITAARTELLDRAVRSAERQERLFADTQVLLAQLTVPPRTTDQLIEDCRNHFPSILPHLDWLTALSVLNIDGHVVCSTSSTIPTQSVADRAYFRDAVATRAFTISDYLIGRVSGRPTVVAAMPRVEGNTVTAVVTGAIDVDWFSRIALATERPSPGVEAMVLDAAATVIGGSPNLGERLRGQSFLPSAIWPAPSDRGVVDRFEFEGGTYVAAYVALPATGGTLVIMKGRDAVLTVVNQEARQAITVLALLSVFVFALVWLGGERLVLKPIKALTKTADALGSGDLSARATLAGFAPEFRRLGLAFNTMGRELQVRNDDLSTANRKLDKLARSDALTGLRNRRAFDEQLELEVARSMREQRPLSLLMMDIDHFKQFNDRYGHAAGDDAMVKVAAVIETKARRPGDIAARIGGEEFALVLGDCSLKAGQEIADDIVRSVAALRLDHAESDHQLVTMSIGVAELELGVRTSIRSLVEQADKALYRAKMLGRNRSESGAEGSLAARV